MSANLLMWTEICGHNQCHWIANPIRRPINVYLERLVYFCLKEVNHCRRSILNLRVLSVAPLARPFLSHILDTDLSVLFICLSSRYFPPLLHPRLSTVHSPDRSADNIIRADPTPMPRTSSLRKRTNLDQIEPGQNCRDNSSSDRHVRWEVLTPLYHGYRGTEATFQAGDLVLV